MVGVPMVSRRDFFVTLGLGSLAAAATGCQSDEVTAFVPGIMPLEASTAAVPTSANGEPYPEVITLNTGVAVGYEWAHGRAFVRAPLARVYEALADADITCDRRRVTEYMVTPDVEPEYMDSYRVHNIVRDVITLEFDIVHRLDVYDGSPDVPTAMIVAYQKVFGSSLISVLRGSVIARRIDDNTTSLELVRHIKSVASGRADAAQYLQDFFASVLARVNGRPLPTY